MPDTTQQPPEQPTPAKPQPNRIADAPATVETCAEDFSSGASVRATMAKQQTLRRATAAGLIAVAALVTLGACSSVEPAAKPTPSAAPAIVEPKPAAEELPATVDTRELTEVAVQMTWAGSTEQAKDDMCAGVDMLGTDWAAEQLRTGGGRDSELDWPYAAELIKTECDAR